MTKAKRSSYVLESSAEAERLDRQSRMKGYDFRDELRFLKITSGQKVLDAGCGSGIVTDYLSKLAPGVSVLGLDFSKDRIRDAQARYGASDNIRFAQANLLELDTTERFDTIVCRFVLRHLTAAQCKRLVQSFAEILKPGGTLCCIDVEGLPSDVFPASAFLRRSLLKMREAKTVSFQIARQLPSLLMANGLQDVDWNGVISEFKGEELLMEIDNLEWAFDNARAFATPIVGGPAGFERFKKEYFSALRKPGQVLFYNRVVAIGTKPKSLRLVAGQKARG